MRGGTDVDFSPSRCHVGRSEHVKLQLCKSSTFAATGLLTSCREQCPQQGVRAVLVRNSARTYQNSTKALVPTVGRMGVRCSGEEASWLTSQSRLRLRLKSLPPAFIVVSFQPEAWIPGGEAIFRSC